MIHMDGIATIANSESEPVLETILSTAYDFGGIPSEERITHYVVIEVDGELVNAEDFRNNISKLEYPGLGSSLIINQEHFNQLIDSL